MFVSHYIVNVNTDFYWKFYAVRCDVMALMSSIFLEEIVNNFVFRFRHLIRYSFIEFNVDQVISNTKYGEL